MPRLDTPPPAALRRAPSAALFVQGWRAARSGGGKALRGLFPREVGGLKQADIFPLIPGQGPGVCAVDTR